MKPSNIPFVKQLLKLLGGSSSLVGQSSGTNYSKVQFISWELNTGPNSDKLRDIRGWFGEYIGIKATNLPDQRVDTFSQCLDIQARVWFTQDALEKAILASNIDRSQNTLKVLIAPEFLYRGSGGAYLHDLINGWESNPPNELGLTGTEFDAPWPGLFGMLKQLVADDKFANWVVVFGTAISASFVTKKGDDGKYLIDTSQPAELYNTSLIQLGGRNNKTINYTSRKHYKSHIDFLNYQNQVIDYAIHLDGNINPFEPSTLIPIDSFANYEGSAVFRLPGVNDTDGNAIDFGIEICLDHLQSATGIEGNNNPYGRIRNANKWVRIQLVPSGGAELEQASIRLRPTNKSYAINSDGLNNLNSRGGGCHTQVWNSNCNPIYACSNGALVPNTVVTPLITNVSITYGIIAATQLWATGAGSVRVMNPLPL